MVRRVPANPETAKKVLEQLKMYPYTRSDNPPKMEILDAGTKTWNGQPPRGMEYWERLNDVIQREPVEPGVDDLACNTAEIDVVQHQPQQRCGQRQHDQSAQMRSHERQKRLLLYRSSAVHPCQTLHVVVVSVEAPL